MHLEHLRLFHDVARTGSLTEGARLHGFSQSAASQAIAQIETALQASLFDRSCRPLALTVAGRRFQEGVATLVADWDRLAAAVRPAGAGGSGTLTGTVTVAAIYSVGIHLLSTLVQRFATRHPQVRVRMQYLRPDMVVQAVRDKRVDLGILSFPPTTRALTLVPLRDEPLVAVCHPAHRLVPRRRITMADLAGQRLVAFDRDLPIRRAIDEALRKAGVRVEVSMELDNVESIKQAVQSGCGMAILPEPTVVRETISRLLVALPIEDVKLIRPIGLIRRRRPADNAAVDIFIDFLTVTLREEQHGVATAPVAPVRYGQTPSLWE